LYAEEITSEKAKIPIENLDSLSQETGEIDDLERQHVVLFNLFRERVGIGDFIFPKKIKDGNNYLTALRVGKEDSQPWYEWIYEDGTTVKGLQEEKILNKVLTLLSQETSSLSDSDKAHSPL
jgi:hypothetical protein